MACRLLYLRPLLFALAVVLPVAAHAAPKKPTKAKTVTPTSAPAAAPVEAAPTAPAPPAAIPSVSTDPRATADAMQTGGKDKFDVGELAPVFALRAVNGDVISENTVAVDRYFGSDAKLAKKAVLISFFATWCEPCKRELPFLAALYDTYKDKGVMVVSVSIDREPEQIDVIKSLATAAGAKYPVLSDRFNIVAKRYMVSKLPLVYVVSPDGKVAFSRVGFTEETPRAVTEEIRKLIGESNAPIPDTLSRFLYTSTAVASAQKPSDAVAANATVTKTTTVSSATGTTETTSVTDAPTKGKKAKSKTKKKR
ncbi:MAG: TlpA family protein disulfide reductase [Clostridia bacterium]|nr:TlpA family protein disulfide reductase [Deltaproteobacteria bacterium]